MTIDWNKEVTARKEELFSDLFALLSIPSVREDDLATKEAPVGPGPKNALKKFLEMGERDGFITKNIDNLAGHIEYGHGEETLGIFGHVDVVPVGSGWETDPFTPEIRDGKIYARGSSDDKGPSVACYYGMKIIKELNLPVSKKIRFIIGTDEESGWKCMDRYFQVEEKPDFGFSPDAEFPIINGEKGNITLRLQFGSDNGGDYSLKSFTSGLRENMVPESASAVVIAANEEAGGQMKKAFEQFLKESPVSGSIKKSKNKLEIKVVGKSAHGAMPESGINAGTYLGDFLAKYDFSDDAELFLKTIAQYIHLDTVGKHLGVNYVDEKMGALSMNAGLFSFKADVLKENYIALNFRFPKGVTPAGIEEGIKSRIDHERITLEVGRTQLPHYVPLNDPLVQTLLAVYEEHTGEKGAEKVIGGGTFGRLLERGVAYGAMFPDSIDTMHQANEFLAVKDLLRAAVIYADAIYRLAK